MKPPWVLLLRGRIAGFHGHQVPLQASLSSETTVHRIIVAIRNPQVTLFEKVEGLKMSQRSGPLLQRVCSLSLVAQTLAVAMYRFAPWSWPP